MSWSKAEEAGDRESQTGHEYALCFFVESSIFTTSEVGRISRSVDLHPAETTKSQYDYLLHYH